MPTPSYRSESRFYSPSGRPATHARLANGGAAALALAALLSGCTSPGTEESAARDRAAAEESWQLVLSAEGVSHETALQSMDIFLQEDEDSPEPFAIQGDGVRLAGTIPAAFGVGYEEDLDRLVGRRLKILPAGFDASGDFDSSIDLESGPCAVLGGWIEIEKVTGKWAGSEGNRTLHGTIELRTEDGVIRGRIGVHAISWG